MGDSTPQSPKNANSLTRIWGYGILMQFFTTSFIITWFPQNCNANFEFSKEWLRPGIFGNTMIVLDKDAELWYSEKTDEKDGDGHMENNYRIRAQYVDEWKNRLSPEEYDALVKKGVDIEDVVALARKWDMALQRVLDQLETKS